MDSTIKIEDGVDWTTTENCEGLSASIERFESTRGDPEVVSIKDELSIKIEPNDGEEFWIDKDDPELEAELRRFSFLARKTPLAGKNLRSFDLPDDEIKHDFVKKDGVDWTTTENCEGLSASIERFESTRGDPEVLSIKDELSIKIEPNDGEEFWIDKDDPELEAELRRFSFLARKTPLAGENLGSFYLSDDEIKHDFVKKEEITGDDLFSNHEKIPDISSTSSEYLSTFKDEFGTVHNLDCHVVLEKLSETEILKWGRTNKRVYNCEFCVYATKFLKDLKRHKLIHTGERPFNCGSCDYKAGTVGNLKRHMIIHTEEKPFACDKCNFRTKRSHLLKNHIKSCHNGEKPHACHTCDFRAEKLTQLKTHLTSHSHERRYACDICGYRTSNKINLLRHKSTHTDHKPYSCCFCSYSSGTAFNMQIHLRVHTGERPNACQFCDFKTRRRDCLEVHIKKLHNNNKNKLHN